MKNEPAYPIVETDSYNSISAGLTKREYFAGLAMQGTISNQEWLEALIAVGAKDRSGTAKAVCKASVEFADALLEALNESK